MKKAIKLQRILIAIDDTPYSEKALHYGHHLAKEMKAKVALVHVNELPVVPVYVGNPVMGESPTLLPELMAVQEENSKNLFERATKNWEENIQLYTFTRLGNIRDEILDVAQEWKADLIILGTHGRTGLDHFLVGSVAESVARKSECPVLIIPNKAN